MNATYEELQEWIHELRDSDLLIIVEGLKDKRALVRVGMEEKKVRHLNKPLYAIVEEIAEKEKQVVILTDLDEKGKQLYGKLKKDLAAHGVRVDYVFREFLQRRTKVSHIEGLASYVEKREKKVERIA